MTTGPVPLVALDPPADVPAARVSSAPSLICRNCHQTATRIVHRADGSPVGLFCDWCAIAALDATDRADRTGPHAQAPK